MLKITVTGNTQTPFKQTSVFNKTALSNGIVTSENGTQQGPIYSIVAEDINIAVPDEGSFSISVTYTEFGASAPSNPAINLSSCPNPTNPTTNQPACYIWTAKATFQPRTVLMCDPADVFTVNNDGAGKRIGSCS